MIEVLLSVDDPGLNASLCPFHFTVGCGSIGYVTSKFRIKNFCLFCLMKKPKKKKYGPAEKVIFPWKIMFLFFLHTHPTSMILEAFYTWHTEETAMLGIQNRQR